MRPRLAVRILAAGLGLAVVGGCSAADRPAAGDSPATASSHQPSARASAGIDDVPRAQPWADRPVVDLRFDVSDDHSVVTGAEAVSFRPDARVCELVFRAWPNKPETYEAGNSLVVTGVTVDGRSVRPLVRAAGAPADAPGSLVEVPLPRCVDAGGEVAAELEFTVRLGPSAPERLGFSTGDRLAWFATAFPLLAWERGEGWMTHPAVEQAGETVGSEAFRLKSLEVVAPAGDRVLATGQSAGTAPGPRPGTTLHRFTAESVRDVAVTVGELTVAEREVDGVRLHVGGPATGRRVPLEVWLQETENAIRDLTRRFGPFPYRDLWITVAPAIPTGIEFPGHIQYADIDPRSPRYTRLIPHELAHMYFYGLVGNDQGRDPWLDEAFATYAESAVLENSRALRATISLPPRVSGKLGEPMTFWARDEVSAHYALGVYYQGGRALVRAREAAGDALFDAAIREYIDANAHQIATPADVRVALAPLPEAVRILDEAGAFARAG